MAVWQRGYKVHANIANIAKMGANIANIDVSMCRCVDVSMCQQPDLRLPGVRVRVNASTRQIRFHLFQSTKPQPGHWKPQCQTTAWPLECPKSELRVNASTRQVMAPDSPCAACEQQSLRPPGPRRRREAPCHRARLGALSAVYVKCDRCAVARARRGGAGRRLRRGRRTVAYV